MPNARELRMIGNLKGRRVLITGAGVRVGRAIAVAFAKAGARVVIHCRRSVSQANELCEQLGGVASGHAVVQADLRDKEQRSRLIPDLVQGGERLDCLVNNASTYRRRPLLRVDEDFFEEDYGINFLAPFMLMRDFALRCGEGNIINLLDQRVATVEPSAATYGLAKKSLRDVTEAAALEWAPKIRVNGVAPGFVLSPPGVAEEKIHPLLSEVPMKSTSELAEIADACLFLAGARTITGQILYVDGGMHLKTTRVPEVTHADYSSY